MPRGGRRRGAPGKSYSNRTDLNSRVVRIPGQTYGKQAEQVAAQQVVPPGPQPVPPPPSGGGQSPEGGGGFQGLLQAAASFPFQDQGPIDRETEFPDEPVTAGAPFGPGPGPDPSLASVDNDPALVELRGLYRQYPTEAIRELIEDIEVNGE